MAFKINTDYSYSDIKYCKYTIQQIKNIFLNKKINVIQIKIQYLTDSVIIYSINEKSNFNKLASELAGEDIYGEAIIFHSSELPLDNIQTEYKYEDFEKNVIAYLDSFTKTENSSSKTLRVDEVNFIINNDTKIKLDYNNEEHNQIAFGIFNIENINEMELVNTKNETFLIDEFYLILLKNNGQWDIYFKNGGIS